MASPALPITPALERRLSGEPLVLLLDIDGTLSPIAPRPHEAAVPEETRHVLRELVALPGASVAIISGRSAEDARRIVGVQGLWAIGNHGIEVSTPDGEVEVRPSVLGCEHTIAEVAHELTSKLGGMPGVLVENKRWTLSIHYRLSPPDIVAEVQRTVTEVAVAAGLLVTHGAKVLEVRPPVAIDKGIAAVDFAAMLGALAGTGAVLCAGDDRTDEDAFRALRTSYPASVTIHVTRPDGASGRYETAAEFTVAGTEEMLMLLEWLASYRRGLAASRPP
jgi:trehalose-phosphatase